MNFKDGQQLNFLLSELVGDVDTHPNAGTGGEFCSWLYYSGQGLIPKTSAGGNWP